MEEMIW